MGVQGPNARCESKWRLPMSAPDTCPECGAMVPANAKACPECGADEETGWSERAQGQRLGLPDDEFDYDEFVKEEFGEEGRTSRPLARASQRLKPRGVRWLWWVVGVLLLLAFAFSFLRHALP
jgi:hypothetical protein